MTSLIGKGVGVTLGAGFELKPMDFALSAGELVGIVGPNGSGKTTLLRVLSGALQVDCGQVEVNAQPLSAWDARALARKLAFVSQHNMIQFPFTAAQVVLLGRSPHQDNMAFETAEDLRIAAEAMETTDTLHLKDRLYSSLSGGEQQRVAISRALAQTPDILLLDEPTASLDLKHQVQILRLLQDRAHKGLAIGIVLHDLNSAARWCDRVYLLLDGAVSAAGTAEKVLTPNHIEAAFGVAVTDVSTPGGHRVFVPNS